jgi:hypothetical protein
MISPLNLNQVLDLETIQQKQLWGDALKSSQLMMVYAATGVGKSFFTWALGLSLATGSRFLGTDCPAPLRVLLAEGEMGLAYTKKRLGILVKSLPYSPRGDHFRVLSKDHCGGQLWNISNPEHQRRYNALFADCDVIILDNLLSCAFPMDRRDNEFAMWERIAPWLFMVRDSGRSVILVHHTNKGGQQQMGASTKMNWLDTAIELRAPASASGIDGMEFELRFTKTRDIKRSQAQPLLVTFQDDGLGVSRWGSSPLLEGQEATVRDCRARGMNRREVARATGMSLQAVQRVWEQEDLNI